MRQYDKEGWIQQLQGRRVVGHYNVATNVNALASAVRFISMRNPLGPSTERQRMAHVIKIQLSFALEGNDDAAGDIRIEASTVSGFTVSDGVGGTALDPVNLMRSGIASALEGRVSTAAIISGGTLGTTEQSILGLVLAQPAATGTDASKDAHVLWTPSWGPIQLAGDTGLIVRCSAFMSSPATVAGFASVEWLESEKM